MKWLRWGLCALSACGGSTPLVETSAPASTGVEAGVSYAEALQPAEDVGATFGGGFVGAMPVAVTSFGAAVHDEHLYVLGGYGGEPHRYNRTGQSTRLWRMNLATAEWEEAAQLPHGIQGSPLVTVGDQVCALGGLRIDNAPEEPVDLHSSAEAMCYVPASGSWARLPSLPEARSSADAFAIGSTLCVFGGWTLAGETSSGEWRDQALCLDVEAAEPQWQAFEQPFQRRALAVATRGDAFVVLGGMDAEGEVSDATHYFTLDGEWRQGPSFPERAFGAAAVNVGGEVYASAMSGTVYRLGDDAWEPVGALAFKRFFHRFVNAGGRLVALGGVGGMHTHGRVRIIEAFEPGAGMSLWTRSWDGTAKNRQAMFVDGEFLHLYGGNNSLGQHDFAESNFVAEGWRVHLPSMRAEEHVAFPVPRQTLAVTEFGGRTIAVGGFGHNGTDAVSHPEVFALGEDGWTPDGALPASRTQFGLTTHEGDAWIFGGLAYDPTQEGEAAFDHVTSVLRRSAGAESFEVVDDLELPGPRRAFAGAAVGDDYYLIGGMRGGFQLVDDCLKFNFSTRAFEEIACPAPRLSGDLIVLGGRLVLFGGSVRTEEGIEASQAIEVFDPANPDAGWQHVADAPFSTRHARAFAYDERLLVVSTHSEEDRLRVALMTLSTSDEAAGETP